jgi:hypothetical protein
MGAEVDGVEVCALPREPPLEHLVREREIGLGEHASCDARLVGRGDDREAGLIQAPDRRGRTGQQPELTGGPKVVDLPDDRPITVQEHSRPTHRHLLEK